MKFHQIRNATMVLELASERLLIDPMLSAAGKLPSFRMRPGNRRRNPLVALPANANQQLESVTGVLLTHVHHVHHVDHLDAPGRKWITSRSLPGWVSTLDVPEMRRKGLDAQAVAADTLGWQNEVVLVSHGRGLVGWLMGQVTAFYFEAPGEPSVFLTSDAVMTADLLATIERLAPDVIIAPAGSANFGFGGDILFSEDELIALTKAAPGRIIFNHLESLDHCPTTRAELRARLRQEDLDDKALIPEDGETLDLGRGPSPKSPSQLQPIELGKPGLRKWLVNQIARVPL